MFVEAFDKKYGYKPEWGANNAYMSVRDLGAHGVGSRHVLSAGRHQGSTRRARPSSRPSATCISARRTTSSSVPVVIVKGKAPKDMKNKEDYWEVLEVVPGEPLMQKPDAFGCNLGDYT